MGSYLDKPVTEKISETGSGNDISWGSSCMQGWRTGMEDAHITIASLGGNGNDGVLSSMSLFGVFDGHGGREVAAFCHDFVPPVFCRCMKAHGPDVQTAMIGDALTRTFLQMDDMLRKPEYYQKAFPNKGGSTADGPQKPRVIQMMEEKLKDRVEADMAAAKRDGRIAKGDAEKLGVRMNMLKKLAQFPAEGMEAPDPNGPASSVGCTAVCVVLTPLHIICANAGDSRAVLCRSGASKALSVDHKPNMPSERARIEAAGGTIETQQAPNGGRVQFRVRPGGLSLSRAIGDLQGKTREDLQPEQQVISAAPDVVVEARSAGDDEFIVIACDGIWDVKSNSEVCDFVRRRLMRGVPITAIIEDLMDACMCKDPKATCGIGGDNMTCVIVLLQSKDAFVEKINSGKSKSCFPFLCGRSTTK
mmetsp:Transcript_10566/g.17275  ORF Transcript_10566/g.17275 Transcript_10566/m.17275 type:complete len:418 (-) Transcript_10566:30-1283(-)